MIVLGVDVETNGGSETIETIESKDMPDDSEIIEIGLSLYDTDLKISLASYAMLYKPSVGSNQSALSCHGIPDLACDRMGNVNEEDPFKIIQGWRADYIVAHNASHDHPKVTKIWRSFLDKKWLCTINDFDHSSVLPRKVTSKRLGHLCVDYGINLSGWHRALADAEACARIAGFHNLDEAYKFKCAPKFRLIASGPFIKDLDPGKKLREAPSTIKDKRWYRWNVDGYPKCWVKEGLLKEDVVIDADYIKQFSDDKWSFNLEKMDPPVY